MNTALDIETVENIELIAVSQLEGAETQTPEFVFEQAARRRDDLALPYAGAVTPTEAWALVRLGAAVLVDVRTAAELKYVGRVPGSLHIEWPGGDPVRRRAFVQALREAVPAGVPIVLLCRSAVRSHHAATAAHEQGMCAAYNVLEGFEGTMNDQQQRGHVNGWRKHGLPWVQD